MQTGRGLLCCVEGLLHELSTHCRKQDGSVDVLARHNATGTVSIKRSWTFAASGRRAPLTQE